MPDIADRLREGVRQVGESEPLIAVGKAMGKVYDYGADLISQGRDYLKKRTTPPRDIVLPKDRPVRRQVRRSR